MSSAEFELSFFLDANRSKIEHNHKVHETLGARFSLRDLGPTGDEPSCNGSVVEERYDDGVVFYDSPFLRKIPYLPDF